MERNRIMRAVLLLLFLMLPFSGCSREPGRRLDPAAAETEAVPGSAAHEADTVVVYVCGYVREPGVYTHPADARAGDARGIPGGVERAVAAGEVLPEEVLAEGDHAREGDDEPRFGLIA